MDAIMGNGKTNRRRRLERAADRASKSDARAYERLLEAQTVTIAGALARMDEIVRRGPAITFEIDTLAADLAFIREKLARRAPQTAAARQ